MNNETYAITAEELDFCLRHMGNANRAQWGDEWAQSLPLITGEPRKIVDLTMPDGWLHLLPPVALNAHQLKNALDFVNPDGAKDTDQLESMLCISYRKAAEFDGEQYPAGFYAHFEDYPEEGSIFLDDDKSTITHAQPLQPITADMVTDAMKEQFLKTPNGAARKDVFLAAVNVWIKHKGDTK